MLKKLMHNTVAAAGFAALLLVGACASTNDTADVNMAGSGSETVQPNGAQVGLDADVNVHPERSAIDLSASNTVESTTLTSEEAIVDEANARGTIAGTSLSTGGTVIGRTSDSKNTSGTMASGSTSSSLNNNNTNNNNSGSWNNNTTTTTTQTQSTTVPMTSSSSADTQSTTTTNAGNDTDTDTTATTTTRTRTRMRKD